MDQMLRAVTNRYFPMLAHTMRDHFGIELDHDPALEAQSKQSFRNLFTRVNKDPEGRIRILFVDGTDDLSRGWFRDRDVIGRNMGWLRLILIAVPEEFDFTSEGCAYNPKTRDGYLLAVALHELYELLTNDLHHCHNPGTCVNSVCRVSDKGHCCLCMGGLIERKWPDITLEELYCEEDLAELRLALGRLAE
jgi:hypothetical protein